MSRLNPPPTTVDEHYRALLVIWFALCMSLLIYLVFTRFLTVATNPNQKLTLLLNTIGLIPVAASFLIKQVLLSKAVEAQQIQQVRVAYVLAFALCEVAGLLSFLNYFLTGSTYYYLGFAIGGAGLLLHFPRRQYLLDASQPQF